ncbi:MAG: beta-ketoacyl-ACP synthase II, partial [Rhodospirillales bacterium]
MKRVVVTGIGLVTPLGCGIDHVWDRLVKGDSGIRDIETFDVSDLPARIGGEVPRGDSAEGLFNIDEWVPTKEQRRMDSFIEYGMGAAQMAVRDSGWMPEDEESKCRTGVLIGAGIGGLPEISKSAKIVEDRNVRKLSPFFIPASLINLVAGHVSIKFGFKGPCHAVVTACSSGAHAIGDAARMIMLDDADVMVAGGAEAAMCRLGVAGFAQARALSTNFNDSPEKASRPWDQDRDGFVMGDGSGIVVLEELEHARKRGAKIYAELIGYGMSGDANH